MHVLEKKTELSAATFVVPHSVPFQFWFNLNGVSLNEIE